MPDTSTCTTDITFLQDRIAILEDLLACHAQLSAEGAERLLRLAAALGSETVATASSEALRVIIGITRVGLTRLANEITCGTANAGETLAALKRCTFIPPHSRLPS